MIQATGEDFGSVQLHCLSSDKNKLLAKSCALLKFSYMFCVKHAAATESHKFEENIVSLKKQHRNTWDPNLSTHAQVLVPRSVWWACCGRGPRALETVVGRDIPPFLPVDNTCFFQHRII